MFGTEPMQFLHPFGISFRFVERTRQCPSSLIIPNENPALVRGSGQEWGAQIGEYYLYDKYKFYIIDSRAAPASGNSCILGTSVNHRAC